MKGWQLLTLGLVTLAIGIASFMGWRLFEFMSGDPLFGFMPFHAVTDDQKYVTHDLSQAIQKAEQRSRGPDSNLAAIIVWCDRRIRGDSHTKRSIIEIVYQKGFDPRMHEWAEPRYDLSHLKFNGLSGEFMNRRLLKIRDWPWGMKTEIYPRPLRVRDFENSYLQALTLFLDRSEPILSLRDDFTIRYAKLSGWGKNDAWQLSGSTDFTEMPIPDPNVVSIHATIDADTNLMTGYRIFGTPDYVQRWEYLEMTGN